MLGISDLTWICHVCADERLDERISVYSQRKGNIQVNVRYCNDRSPCRTGAVVEAYSRLGLILGSGSS